MPLPGRAGMGVEVRALQGGPGTQRALLLLPDPIIPSPTLSQGLGGRQEGLRQRCPCPAPPRGRGAVLGPLGSAGTPGQCWNPWHGAPGVTRMCRGLCLASLLPALLEFCPSCSSLLAHSAATPGWGCHLPPSLRSGAPPWLVLPQTATSSRCYGDFSIFWPFSGWKCSLSSLGKHLVLGHHRAPLVPAPPGAPLPQWSCRMREGGSWGISPGAGGVFLALFLSMSAQSRAWSCSHHPC